MSQAPKMQAINVARKLRYPPEVYPLIGIMSIAIAGVTAFCMYAMTKNDVVINHHDKIPPWEKDLQRTELRKLIHLKPLPQLPAQVKELKEEMNKQL